jgi:ABC-2 type transport system ATP-binding protein
MDYAISTSGLSRKFGNFIAVDQLTLNIKAGEICGFLGPNGAGKSTAIRMLCGILEPTSGSAVVLNYSLGKDSEQIKRRIGYMSQKFSLYDDLQVAENLDFYAGVYGIAARDRKKRVAEMLAMADLLGRERELVSNLSSGFRQRLALGCAIISRPALVFLDEPTSGVSPTSRRDFFKIIKNLSHEGTTVIVTTHFMDEAERCDRIAFISSGRLLAMDNPDELKRRFITGILLELTIPDPMQAMDKIESLPGVKECNIYGSMLHVLVENEASINMVGHTAGTIPRIITPSLEDVFVTLARHQEKGGEV